MSQEIIDPTENVKAMLKAAVDRLDDLRSSEMIRVNEQMRLRDEYAIQLSIAEAKRIDAIRAVDVNAVSVANERATAQAAVLANQVAASAETLRSLVAATASTVAQQLSLISSQFNERISTLEKAQYESKGSGVGMKDMGAWIFAGIMAIVTIASILWSSFHK